MDSQPTDKAKGVGEDFVRGGQDKTPTQKKRNNYEPAVVKADTPAVTVTKGNEQYSAPWVVESPEGKVTTSAYNDGKKRCLSAEGGSGDPRKKLYEQNNTFNRVFNRSGHLLSKDEICAEALKRQKEMRGAARAAEMTEEEVALEKLEGLLNKYLRQGPTPIFSAATVGGRTTVQTASAAAKTLPTTPTRER